MHLRQTHGGKGTITLLDARRPSIILELQSLGKEGFNARFNALPATFDRSFIMFGCKVFVRES